MDPTAAPQLPPMFACLIPSRPLQTNGVTIPPDKVVFEFDHAEQMNHLVVFLTGAVPMPEGYAASVHFLFPSRPQWQLLGMISPAKPSAIFKLRGTVISPPAHALVSTMAGVSTSLNATLGLHLAPIAQIEAECAHLNPTTPGSTIVNHTPMELAKAIGLHVFNYLTSFAVEIPGRNGAWIELGTLEKWWKSFESRCQANPRADKWLLEGVKG